MKIIVENFKNYINSINELSFNAKEIDYDININKDQVEYIIRDTDSDDILKVVFNKVSSDIYERIFKLNDRTTKLSNNQTNFSKNILKYVSYITNIFIHDYKPVILMLIHMGDAMLSSEKRMIHNLHYLKNMLSGTGYQYEIIKSDTDYATFVYNDMMKYKNFRNDFFSDIPAEIIKK